MDAEKYILPLTVVASIAAIWVFLRSGSGGVQVTEGTLPTAGPIGSYAYSPQAAGNIAVMNSSPPPVVPGTGIVAYSPSAGIITNNGAGAPYAASQVPASLNGPTCCNSCSSTNAAPNNPAPSYAATPQNLIYTPITPAFGHNYLNSFQ